MQYDVIDGKTTQKLVFFFTDCLQCKNQLLKMLEKVLRFTLTK